MRITPVDDKNTLFLIEDIFSYCDNLIDERDDLCY